jgi:hypothetical protein
MKTNDIREKREKAHNRLRNNNKTTKTQTSIIRSTTMESFTSIITKGVVALCLILIVATMAMGQSPAAGDLVITNNTTTTGTGTINIKGNIIDSATSVKSLAGTTHFWSNANKTIGLTGTAGDTIKFDGLVLDSAGTQTMNVPVKVTTSMALSNGVLAVNGKGLYIQGSSSSAGSTNLLANGSSDQVNYEGISGNQTIIGTTYHNLNLLNGATKSLAGNVTASNDVTHTNGALTVDQNLTASNTYAFGTVANVASGKTLTLSGQPGTIAAIADVTSGGTVQNGSGLLTVTNLTNNHGAINTAAGGATFTNAAVNNGAITGGAGSVAFSSTLNNQAGVVTAGSGDIAFNGAVTVNGGSITSANSTDSLAFNQLLTLNSGGKLALTGTGVAGLNNTFTSNAGDTLSFSTGSTVYYNNGSPIVAKASYGNLTLTGSAKTTTGPDTVAGNLTLSRSITMGANTMLLTSATGAVVSDSGEVIGAVERKATFTAGAMYAFNRSDVSLAVATGGAEDMTLTMTPSTSPSSVPSAKYVNRKYAFSRTAGLDNISQIQLHFATAEEIGSPDTTKFGIRTYNGANWTKIAAAGYTHVLGGSFAGGNLHVSGAPFSTSSVSEFGIFPAGLITIASAPYDQATTWDEGRVPDATDDATVVHNVTLAAAGTAGTLSMPANGTAQGGVAAPSITINSGGNLAVVSSFSNFATTILNGTAIMSLSSTSGTYNNTGTLTLSNVGGIPTLNVAGIFYQNGTLNNNGRINLGQ